jgi:glycerol-3-phosphate acyltransferase PlsY
VRALRAAATFARVALRVAACFDACKATFAVLLLAIFAAAAAADEAAVGQLRAVRLDGCEAAVGHLTIVLLFFKG